ncbi:MAG: BlaI/MecI/CopY family transcriptional regulator [Chitinophagales bacterium]
MERLSIQEEQAMQAIWKTGEGNLKLILENMDEPKPPYTTLASTVKNLEKKGYLASLFMGSVYFYKPNVSEEEYKKTFIQGFVEDYFFDSYHALIHFIIDQKKLIASDLQEIVDKIERKNNPDG